MNKEGGIDMFVARDKNKYLNLFIDRPKRNNNEYWFSTQYKLSLDYTLFPGLRWEDEPIEVDLVDVNKSIITDKDCIDEVYWREVRNNAAIAAMQSMIGTWKNTSLTSVLEEICDLSVKYADYLIKELKK